MVKTTLYSVLGLEPEEDVKKGAKKTTGRQIKQTDIASSESELVVNLGSSSKASEGTDAVQAAPSSSGKGGGGGSGGGGGIGGGRPGGDESSDATAGNNLSFPVIWAEGVTKTLPGFPGMTPLLNGEFWYHWGTDADDNPLSGPPDPDNPAYVDNGEPGTVDSNLFAADLGAVKAYLQKDPGNTWQAYSEDGSGAPVYVDDIDWGDNLESVDWYTRSQVRTEVVLYKDLATPMLEYQMRHVSGWGIDEVHGLATNLSDEPLLGPGTQATVFSPHARLTIQKLYVDRDNSNLDTLEWSPGEGWIDPLSSSYDLINDDPLFNGAVHEAGDGPGYYNAEINVKGKIIYGYTWNVRKLNEGAGDYRITFSFDELTGLGTTLNTFLDNAEILLPEEEEEEAAIAVAEADDGGVEGGATAVIDFGNNLTYIDVRILERSGGGGGKGGGGSKGKGRPQTAEMLTLGSSDLLQPNDPLQSKGLEDAFKAISPIAAGSPPNIF